MCIRVAEYGKHHKCFYAIHVCLKALTPLKMSSNEHTHSILLHYLHEDGSMRETVDDFLLHIVLGVGCAHEQASSGCS